MNPVGCSILAGGKNSRMGGESKAFLTINGSNLLDTMINNLEKIFDEIIIVTNSPYEFNYLNQKCIIITDLIKNIGPLGGIYSALSYTSKESVFFFPCDMPYLNNELIKIQISKYNETDCDAVVPKVGNWLEPLHSIFNKNVNSKLLSFINSKQNYSIRNFLKTINVCHLDLGENYFHNKIFTNINTPEDLEQTLKNFIISRHKVNHIINC